MPSSAWSSDRKSTRLNSSHLGISYAVFCLKKHPRLAPLFHFSPRLVPPDAGIQIPRAGPLGATGCAAVAGAGRLSLAIPCCFFFFLISGPPQIFPLFPTPPFSR